MTDKADPDHFSWQDAEEKATREAEEAEIKHLAAMFGRGTGKGPEMPADMVELMWEIATLTFVRMAEPDAAPFQFERFEALDTTFGELGMVIEARDPQYDRKVAIVLLLTGAETPAKFSHPNMIYEAGKWNDRVYLVMEWTDRIGPGDE